MTPFWFCVYAFLIYYITKKLIHGLIIWNEYKLQADAPQVTWTYEEMIAMAKLKKDSQMTDEEFNIKYGAYRHEIYRTTSISRAVYDFMGRILHYIELYFVHGGYGRLNRKMPAIKEPIFVIGDFRSGTSVLERIIEHHPQICAFSTTHAHIWSAPKLFEDIVDWLDSFRVLCGCEGWNSPIDKGMFYPHSSNNVLSRDRPMECESIWLQCKWHYSHGRNYEWDTLDHDTKNVDNNTNIDLLDEHFADDAFEKLLKTSIKMLLLHRKCSRFIWKNPMNGFRIPFIKKMFPDAKFLYISRNPTKTLLSQLNMEKFYCKAHFIDNVQNFRKQNMRPRAPYYNKKEHFLHLFHGKCPNDMYGHLLWPRVWPRTKPEHLRICKYLKQDKTACAAAVGVVQHDRIVNESFVRLDCDLFEIWHEDVLKDPLFCLKKIHKFLGLDCTNITDEDRIKWLECEDFPNGKANSDRVKQSKEWEKGINFGDETDDVYDILKPAIHRYKNRKELV